MNEPSAAALDFAREYFGDQPYALILAHGHALDHFAAQAVAAERAKPAASELDRARDKERARCAAITDPANQDYGTFADPESARKIVEILHKAIVGE